jgi:drug/metabolite transporter (DMT)-like permease
MKKLFLICGALLTCFGASAQSGLQPFYDREFNEEFVHVTGTLIGIYLFTSFFLAIIRMALDSRIKRRMIERGISETAVSQYLEPARTDRKSSAIKWFLICACSGIGLGIVNFNLPLGIHSVAIMAVCISLSFLAYYFFIQRSEKKNPA